MCGIAGIVNLNRSPVRKDILESMVDVQRHRGPDDSGMHISGSVALGHARLSIIDLSKDASQPMSNQDSTLFIVHNGEIYNYLELREELTALGYDFKSKSDTEVILHAYEEWGEGCLNRFNGMWAFAILDTRKALLFCSRDRFGVKPFYYYLDSDLFVFSSEIKAILRHPGIKREPNDRAIFNYLASGYGYMDISDETFFKGINQLQSAHYIKLSLVDNRFSQEKYWDLDPRNRSRIDDENEVYRRFCELFEDSVRLRLRSDVPLGVALSGGLDSSSIACVAAGLLKGKRLEAFSSCFEEAEYDERRFIDPMLKATNANANIIFTKPEDLFKDIEDIIWHQDEPYSTLSIFPQWYVMKLAKEKGVKVLLTGQGGDETLAGYHKYYFYLFADLICSLKWARAHSEIRYYKDLKGSSAPVWGAIFKIMLSYIIPQIIKRGFSAGGKVPSYLNRDFARSHVRHVFTVKKFASILNNDLYNGLKISPLPSLLHIDDRSSMAHGVESRAPFLDYRLVEYLFSLGPEYKIRDGMTKFILRSSFKNILPEEVRVRRDKMGFATPLEKWLRMELKGKVEELFKSKEFLDRPYFDHGNVIKEFKDFAEGRKRDSHYTIWSWVNLELWFRKFID